MLTAGSAGITYIGRYKPFTEERLKLSEMLSRLGLRAQRGSKPRCHWLTHGTNDEVASRLTALAAPFCKVNASDNWMPVGFQNTVEAELDKAPRLLNADTRAQLGKWWLAPASVGAMTPNFDVASTCTIDGKNGLLLIEAKAHERELMDESGGRIIKASHSDDRKQSHEKIGKAISDACKGLAAATNLPWSISRDSHYQISNRLAWAWKLTEFGIPVVLVYLGFLNANEMTDRGAVLPNSDAWEQLVKSHAESLFPAEVWGRKWIICGQAFVPLIRSLEVSLDGY
jgi:hypothetical protein